MKTKYIKPFLVKDENDDTVKDGTRSECMTYALGNNTLKVVKNPEFWK